ncbi:hypothetical protein J3D56_002053 [Erwinia persicina]|nr:hypothetical protein [Erwinia persicina]
MKKMNRFFPALVVVSWLYVIVMMLRPVEVIAVHQNHSVTDILVKNFPLTNKGKIEWWKENARKLDKQHPFLLNRKGETFWVTIWDFKDGYQQEKPDDTTFFPSHSTDHLLCFENIKAEERCIKKENWLMQVTRATTGTMSYTMEDASYYQKPGGPLILEER